MKHLAIFGGKPIRQTRINYGRQWIDDDDIQSVVDTLKSDYLTCGPKVAELEKKLSDYTGAKYAVACSNGTAALHLACITAGIGQGDEVITTPITFAASANCALYCGAKPVFADINAETYNIEPSSIRERITSKTKAIVAVDFTGQAVEHDEIRKICDEFGLVFIEDAAHAIATKYNGKQVGSLANMTCFSFHPVKTITGGEGGAVLTNNAKYFETLSFARTHGITHNQNLYEYVPEGPWEYEQIMLGYNYRITDIQAALLISQMQKLDKFKARRKEIVAMYDSAFSEVPEIIVQKEIPQSDACRHLYIIRLALEKLNCTRREFFDAMSAENIQCQVHYTPVYWFPHYRRLGYKRGLCPKAEKVYKGIMSIPLYPKLTDSDVNDVIAAVKKIVEYYKK